MEKNTDGLIDIRPNHLFRYASEWDPREPGHTKGGYLEGKINLPRNCGNLKVVLTTVSDTPLNLESEITDRFPKSTEIHPTLLYVVRKGKGNRRMNEREPVPNHHHWKQELHIVDKCVKIKNSTSDADLKRYDNIEEIPDVDEMFMLGNDMVLNIGRGSTELNLIILIPKTEARSAEDEVTINQIIADRMPDPEAAESILFNYKKKTSTNIKKLRIKAEIYSLDTNLLLCSGQSSAVSDTASKEHGALDFAIATPLRSCSKGGRKVLMVSEGQIARDVEPKFLLYDQNDRRLEEMDHILIQPNDSRNPSAKNTIVLKESIIFITPAQPNIELIMKNGWLIKLVGVRKSDGFESLKKFIFTYVPDDFYDPCIFCELHPDGNSGKAVLPSPIGPAKPGVKKRRMPDNTKNNEDSIYHKIVTTEFLQPLEEKRFRFSDTDTSLCSPPGQEKTMTSTHNTASKPTCNSLKLKPLSDLQRTYTTSQADELMHDVERNIPPLVLKNPFTTSMPDLIELKKQNPSQNVPRTNHNKHATTLEHRNITIYPEKEKEDSFRSSLKKIVKQSINQNKKNPKKESQTLLSEREKAASFRAMLQKIVNKQSKAKPTMLEKLLMSSETNVEADVDPTFIVKLEENGSNRPYLYPSFQKDNFKERENTNSSILNVLVKDPYIIKIEPEEGNAEPETTRPDLTPNTGIDITSNNMLYNPASKSPDTTCNPEKNLQEVHPVQVAEQTNEREMNTLSMSRTPHTFPIKHRTIEDENLKKIICPVPKFSLSYQTSLAQTTSLTCSNIEMIQHQLNPEFQSELDKLNDLDILDKIFEPLPSTLNDSLQTNYNYASIGKKI